MAGRAVAQPFASFPREPYHGGRRHVDITDDSTLQLASPD